jgi:hypothetical protein
VVAQWTCHVSSALRSSIRPSYSHRRSCPKSHTTSNDALADVSLVSTLPSCAATFSGASSVRRLDSSAFAESGESVSFAAAALSPFANAPR